MASKELRLMRLSPERPGLRWFTRLVSLLPALLAVCLAGCGKPPMLVNQYILDYPAPVAAGKAKTSEALKVDLFSVDQAFNTTSMVYQPQPFQSGVYNYSRWRANPGNLVTDFLVRDLRDSGLFKGVFGPSGAGQYRFKLEGGVVEFQELDAAGGWQASLVLTVALLDTQQEELPQRLVFQKTYRVQAPMPEKTPQGLAQGMSQAMAEASAKIIQDTYEAVRRRSAK